MRIGIAEVSQETNTFNTIPGTLKAFEERGIYYGEEILEKLRGMMAIGGFLDAVESETNDFQLLPIFRAWTQAGGRLETRTLELFHQKLISGLKQILPIDGLFLSLHGALASEKIDDADGFLLASVRQVLGPDVPIVVPLDHHANITRLMIEKATVLVAHETQPHDMFATGRKAAEILFALLRSEFVPAVGWEKIPMISPQDQFLTSHGPMKVWFDMARDMERRPGVIATSTFPMQPWLDVEEAGWATVVYTDRDPDLARHLAIELAEKAWELREQFWVSDRLTPEEAVRKADKAREGLIILSDMGDASGGGSSDGTCLLGEMMRQNIRGKAFVPLLDPEAAERAMTAGIGKQITLTVGGKRDRVYNKPVEVTGRVTAVSRGLKITTEWGMSDLGKTALLDMGNITLVLAENRSIGIRHPIMYTHLGLDMNDAQMVVVKTGSNFQNFTRWRKELIRVDTPGWSQSNLKAFHWKRAPRPIWPLDDLKSWHGTGRP